MDFIKNNWLLLLVLIIAIYLVYKYWQKTKGSNTENTNEVQPIVKDFSNSVKSDTGKVIEEPVIKAPVMNTVSSSWKIGNKMYAGKTGVNTYKAPSTSTSGIVKFYNSDSYIGTFLAIENGYAKMIIKVPTNSLLEAFGYDENAVVYSLVNQIYSK